MAALGEAVRLRREAKGMGQDDLAALIGVSQQTVSRWEQGLAVPRPARVLKLADVLGLDAATLLHPGGLLRAQAVVLARQPCAQVLDTLPELTRAELVQVIEHAWQQLRERDEAPEDQP